MDDRKPAPLNQGTPEPDTLIPIDPRRIIGVLRRRFPLIVLITVISLGFTAAMAYRETPLYSSTAVIRLRDEREAVSGGLAGERELMPRTPLVDPLLSLIEVLTSRGVAGAVIDTMPLLRLQAENVSLTLLDKVRIKEGADRDSLALEFWQTGTRLAGSRPESSVPYGSPLATRSVTFTVRERPPAFGGAVRLISRESAIDGLLGRLTVQPRLNTDIIDVRYTSVDPALARLVATRLVEVFRAVDAEMAREASRARREFLESQLERTEKDLAATRKALSDFRTQARAFSARDRFISEQAGVGALHTRRQELDAQRRLYRTLVDELASPGGPDDGVSALLSSPGLIDNPVIRQIADQLARYESQRDSLTTGQWSSASSNPDVQRLNDLIASSRTRLAGAVRSVASVLDAQVGTIDATRRRELSSFRELAGNEEREAALTADNEAAQRLAEQLRTEHQKARLAEAVDLGQVDVIDYGGPARRLGRGPFTLMLFGLVLGAIAGCLVALVAEYLTPAIRRQDELAATLDAPAGPVVIPRAQLKRLAGKSVGGNGDRALVAVGDPGGGASEAYRALRTTLLFSQGSAGLKSIMVTSPLAGEGKTTVAANLAVVFAQQGVRVLLVDCDLRRSRLHHLFHVQRIPGLTTLLGGTVRPEKAIRSTGVKHLSFLPSGAPPPNPAELVGGSDMAATIEYLVGEFDLVIFDSPPLLAAADASILATLTEGVLLVVRAGKSEGEVVRLAQQQLTTVGARVVASVLNDPDSEVKRYGGDYYFTGYATEPSEEDDS